MDKLLLESKKVVVIAVVLAVGLVIWLALCDAHYRGYWDGTIYRVQTVDFNLLHHTLPPTLSRLMIDGDSQSIQRVLDSTYGIFGLVLTDPSGGSVLFQTHKVYHSPTWQPLISPAYLARITEPYDLLTDPPPSAAAYQHESPRKPKAEATGAANPGRVLGRIYYIRPPAPPFAQDMLGFLTDWTFEVSGARRGYLHITLTVIAFGLAVIVLVLWRKSELHRKAVELEQLEKEIAIKQKALDHLAADLMAQKERKQWLEKEAHDSYGRALALRQALELLRGTEGREAGGTAVSGQPAPAQPPSLLLDEIASFLPDLAKNAETLKSQASELSTYCLELETRQEEMKKILEQAYARAATGKVVQFRPGKDSNR